MNQSLLRVSPWVTRWMDGWMELESRREIRIPGNDKRVGRSLEEAVNLEIVPVIFFVRTCRV